MKTVEHMKTTMPKLPILDDPNQSLNDKQIRKAKDWFDKVFSIPADMKVTIFGTRLYQKKLKK